MRHYRLHMLFFILTLFLSLTTAAAQEVEAAIVPLNILSVTPSPDAANVNPSDGQIVVMFDRSVVPVTALSRPQPLLLIEPALEGVGEWVHPAIYRFTPAQDAMVGGTTYSMTLAEQLVAVDGAILDIPYRWSFHTIEPQVIEIKPTRVWLDRWSTLRDSAFSVAFTQPMDRKSTQAAFVVEKYIGPFCGDGCSQDPRDWAAIEGYFSWNIDNTEITFTPAELLDYGQPYNGSYRATLGTGALNAAGVAGLTRTVDDYFRTVIKPYVASISPDMYGEIPAGLQTVEIKFNTPMNTETYRGRYTVSPTPEGEILPTIGEDGTTLRLTFDHVIGERYTITTLVGMEDIYGTPIEEEFSVTYAVREPKPEKFSYYYAAPENQPFAIIGDYTEALIPLSVFGEVEAELDVYRIDFDSLLQGEKQSQRGYERLFTYGSINQYNPERYYRTIYETVPWVTPENRVSHRVETLKRTNTEEHETMYMALQDSGSAPLPLGLYGIQLDMQSNHVIAVTNVALTLERSADELLVWVTDYTGAQSVADVMIKVQGRTYTAVAKTDSNGLARFPLTAREGFVFVTTQEEDIFGIWFSSEGRIRDNIPLYLYTDRAIYRPGEPVYYRGIVRNVDDYMTYSVPTDLQVYASINTTSTYCDYNYGSPCEVNLVYKAELPLSDFGTFSDTIQLPSDILPGYYVISFSTCPPDSASCTPAFSGQRGFRVAEYRVPEFTVQLTPQYEEVVSMEPINIDVSATYYFGGQVRDALFIRSGGGGSHGTFNYQGAETGYSFGDRLNRGTASVYAPDEYLQIGSDGHYLLNDAPQATGSFPVYFGVEATVIDPSGQSISGKTSILIHPSTVYIGLRLQENEEQATREMLSVNLSDGNSLIPIHANRLLLDETAKIDILTVSHESIIKPNQLIYVDVIEKRVIRNEASFGEYYLSYQDVPLGSTQLQTDENGHGVYEFTPPYVGRFYVVFYTFDERGRRGQSAMAFTWLDDRVDIPDPEPTRALSFSSGCDIDQPVTYLRVWLDKPYDYYKDNKYQPGETAFVSFKNPYEVPVTAFISVGWGDNKQTEIVAVGVAGYTYALPLTAEDSPYISVRVALIRSPMIESELPAYISGGTAVYVDNPARRLNLDITQSTEIAMAGEEVTFDVFVTDQKGQPVIAEIAMSLIDQAISALVSPYTTTLEDHFYSIRRDGGVTLTSSNRALINAAHFGLGTYCGYGGGGGGGGYDPRVRDDFITTPLWEPHVVTDENGHASVSVIMPDNMTQWTLEAQALTMDMKVGEGEASLVTRLPLIVRAIAPRFLVAGDHLPLAAVVHNNTDEPMRVTATLGAQGVTLDNGNPTQIITLAPLGMQRVEWWVTVESVQGVYMAVSAVSDNGLQDASIPTLTTGENNTIPVYAFSVTETLATSGILTEAGEVTERIDLRQTPAPQDVNLTVTLQAELSGALLERIQSLTLSPEPSTLELAQYIRIAVAGLSALDDLSADERIALRGQIQTSVEQLSEQRDFGGGWGWYESMQSDPYITARVLSALADAQAIGIVLDASTVDTALRFLTCFVDKPAVNTPASELNTQAQIVYALAQYDAITLESLDALYEYRLEMSIAARALLLSAYLEISPNAEAIKSLTSDLNGLAIMSATGTHWEESDAFRPYGMEGVQTTAMVLATLLKTDPEYPLAPNTIRWLMTARSNRSLWISEETAWLTIALSAWAQSTDESQPSYNFSVLMNDATMSEGVFTPDAEATQSHQARFSLNDFTFNQPNDVTIQRLEGTGSLYYTAHLNTTYPADEAEEISRGVRIERDYVRDVDSHSIESATAGEIVVVRLTLYVAQDIHYFRLQDVLPAGLEPLDTSLLTTTQQAEEPQLNSLNKQNPYWYWGYQYWGRTKIYDDGISLQARYLPRGVYTYTYQARAISVGTFNVPPAIGLAEQQSEIFGRSKAGYFVIHPQS